MTYSELCATARTKAARAASMGECALAIMDCHDTLNVGGYAHESAYGMKLWAEIDAYRDRCREIEAALKRAAA